MSPSRDLSWPRAAPARALGLAFALSLGGLGATATQAQHAHGQGHGQHSPSQAAPHGQHGGGHGAHGAASPATPADAQDAYAQAEVRRVDAEAGRITLRHGEIPSLDMPPMTMVFHAADKTLLQGIQAGDQVQFKARNDNGRYVLTDIKRAP